MPDQEKPAKKKRRTWLARKLGWIMALAGANPGYRPWEEQPDDEADGEKEEVPGKTPPPDKP
jgi:hypothetical protein